MRNEGFEFKGVLFTGLMMTKNGPKVLEYNVRFGDPETQSLLALMEGDIAEIMVACAKGQLKDVHVKVSNRSAATVVVAAGGYPGNYAKGTPMMLDAVPEGKYFFLVSEAEPGSPNSRYRCCPFSRWNLFLRQPTQDIWRPCHRVNSHCIYVRRSRRQGIQRR
jgi:hypothetical protein